MLEVLITLGEFFSNTVESQLGILCQFYLCNIKYLPLLK